MTLVVPVMLANPKVRDEAGRLAWKKATAVWNTGAQHCAITRSLCDRLSMIPRGNGHFVGIGGDVKMRHDVVYLCLSCDADTFLLALAGVVDSIPGNADMLIGMDVIMQGDFSVSTNNHNIAVSFTPYCGNLKQLRKVE